MEVSLFLAKVLGIYLMIVGLGVLLNRTYFQTVLTEMAESPLFVLLAGVVTLILGSLMIVAHNMWVWDWRVVITLLGWIVWLKGSAYLIAPKAMVRFPKAVLFNPYFYYSTVVVNIGIGLLLFYHVGWLSF